MRSLLKNLIIIGIFGFGLTSATTAEELSGSLALSGAWAIYPTAVVWAEAFEKIHPDVKIDVSAGGAGKGAADAIAGLVDIGMVSREPDSTELKKDIQAIYVLKDAVYPVVSDKNFFLADLLKKGVSKQILNQIYISGTVMTWNQVVGSKGNKPIHVYTRSDSSGAAASWAAYLGKKPFYIPTRIISEQAAAMQVAARQENLKGVGVYGDPGVLEATKRDPVGIGYNNFSYVFTKEGPLIPGIRLVPIDSNENGVADADEIYANRKEAITAIESGRYPASRRNYFFVKNNPIPLVKEFIRFALSEEGTKVVDQVGASLPLQEEERKKVLESLK